MSQLELKMETVYFGPEKSPNPMVLIHGPGDNVCGNCKFLIGLAYSRTYWKCGKRGDLTHGKKTDQRKRWMACSLFEEDDV